MPVKIESEDMFRSVLKSGINLFTGAGFSVLPDKEDNKLPTGEEYSRILMDKFEIKDIEDNLDDVADLLPSESLQNDARQRFRVETINDKYYSINKITLKSFITTNYDNIPLLINEKSQKYKLFDVRGGPQSGASMVPYIPTHGNVLSTEYDIVIGSIRASNVNEYTSDAIKYASACVSKAPTLIWGYGMRDPSTKRILEDVINSKSQNIWIQLLEDGKQANLYRRMGFKIIIADTASLLDWIAKNLDWSDCEVSPLEDEDLRPHLVPSDKSKVPAAETSDYFREGITRWFHILTNIPYERPVVDRILDMAYSCRRVIVIGSGFSGKTTAMMQAAHRSDARNKFFFSNITMEKAEYIASKIGGHGTWIFLDNCPTLRQFVALSKVEDATVVASVSEMLYESEKNLLSDVNCKVIDVTVIDDNLK